MARGMARKNLVWLASYPKSGNTWLRVFLANYLVNAERPVPINEIHRIALGDSLVGAYRAVSRGGLNPADTAAALALRTAVLAAMAGNGADINLVKTHNANITMRRVRMIPPELTRLAVYVVRNPLDMVLSYADHYGMDPATAATAIAAPDNHIVADAGNVAQYLGAWSEHVRGWADCRDFPVATLRYEDMQDDPERAFGAVLRRMGVPVEDDRLARAIRFSSFDELRGQEERGGFRETSRHASRFFRAGRSGQWRDELPPELVERICQRHERVMKRFGYLP